MYRTNAPPAFVLPLADLVDQAWKIGCAIDLSGIGYGRTHWGNQDEIISAPFPYYQFLAGLVRLVRLPRIIEVGTHQGGSARAMAAGLVDVPGAKIVTFDVSRDGSELFAGHPIIRAYNLDANSEAAFDACLAEFGDARVDIAYIDATHNFWDTFQHYFICGIAHEAGIVVLDDIKLNAEMQRFWNLLRQRHPLASIDVTDIHSEIRPRAGFGLIRLGPAL